MQTFSNETAGEWQEYRYDDVVKAIEADAGLLDLKFIQNECRNTLDLFEETHSEVNSLLSTAIERCPTDKFIEDISSKLHEMKVFDAGDFIA
jgi:hypothetical protein